MPPSSLSVGHAQNKLKLIGEFKPPGGIHAGSIKAPSVTTIFRPLDLGDMGVVSWNCERFGSESLSCEFQ